MAIAVYFDPGLLWTDDSLDEIDEPADAELLTVSEGVVWWSAPVATDDDGDDFDMDFLI